MTRPLTWRPFRWPEPLDLETASQALRVRATDPSAPRLVLETWGRAGSVTYLLGAERSVLPRLSRDLAPAQIGRVDVSRPTPAVAAEVVMPGSRQASLSVDRVEAATVAVLTALATTGDGEALVLQLVLGRPRRPRRPAGNPAGPVAGLPWQPVPAPPSELRRVLKDKTAQHGFECVMRLGATAATSDRARGLILGLIGALRTLEAPDVRLRLRPTSARRVADARSPWRWPLRLNVIELAALTGWPMGEPPFPGLGSFHPRRLAADDRLARIGRIVAKGEAVDGSSRALALSATASLQHLHVLGPTGTGQSTLLMNLALQDMRAKRGLVVIDPKGDLVGDLLTRVPTERTDDIVVLDPTDDTPVGLNPLSGQGRSAEARADGVLAVFRGLYGDAWGPRTNDILHACLLTLTRHDQASLVMVPLLLTNAGFRHSIAGRAARDDPLGVGSFWAWYEATSEAERAAAIAPLMNKLRSLLLRPGLRAVLGQTEPRFSVRDVFTEHRILLVSLGKGAIGSEAAALLGSLVIAQFWQTTLARASVAPANRHPVMVYVDEVQDYLHLPTDLGDALAQARGLGVGFTLAHQFLAQLPTAMRAGVLANARSRVCFQLPHDDAAVIVKGHSELTPDDLGALEVHDVYASLLAGGRVMPYAFGHTLPPLPPTINAERVRMASRRRYGRPLSEVEAGWQTVAQQSVSGNLGRRPRVSS